MRCFNRAGLLAVVTSGLALPGVVFAQAVTVPDASAQLTAVTTSLGAYAPIMFGLALAAVGILVGIKWIKRARGAA